MLAIQYARLYNPYDPGDCIRHFPSKDKSELKV